MALTDLTRISTSGIATGTSLSGAILHGDAHFRGTQVGVTSALFDSSENELKFNDNVQLKFGNSGDLRLYHDGSASHIFDNGTGDLRVTTNGAKIDFQKVGGEVLARFITDGSVDLYYNNSRKFQTTQSGSIVTGILTATGFSGPLSNASGISTFYDLRVTNNLTVEGSTTTLDTNLIGVDRVEVGANSNSIVGVAVTQSGTADIVNLFDGATKVVTVDDQGNVGLGSAIPAKKLDIAGDIKLDNGPILSQDSGNSGALKIVADGGYIDVGPKNSNFCHLQTNVPAFFIGKKIVVSGEVASWNSDLILATNSSSAPYAATERMRLKTNGRVEIPGGPLLIGTTTEGYSGGDDLTISTSGDTGMTIRSGTSNQGTIAFSDATSGTDEYRGYVQYLHNGDALLFGTTSTERLRCDSDGVKVHNGRFYSAGTFAYIESSSTSTATLTLRKTASGADSIDYLQLRDNSNAIKFKISGDGILFTSDVLASHEGDTNTKLRFPANDTFTVETAGSERLRITSTGKFGFGGVTPGGTPANKNVFLAIGDSDTGIVQDGDGQLEIFGNGVEVVNFNAIDGYTSTKAISTTNNITIGDSIIHNGDTNTKIRFPTNDTITFETSGDERLRIDANGNIGVNCTPATAGTLYSTVDHFLVIGDSDTGIAQDGDGQLELWANNEEIANLNTSQVTLNKTTIINNSIGLGVVPMTGGTAAGFGSRTYKIAIGDNDSGIAQNGDGNICLYGNNAEVFRIDNYGNAGLGVAPRTAAGGVNNDTDVFLAIGDSDTGIAQDGDGQFEIWANNQEIVNFNASYVTFQKDIHIPQWITHVGDSDSKFGFLQDDIIEFRVAGTQRLKIMNTGEIRIDQGTSANNGIRMRPSGWSYDFRIGAVSSSGGSIWLGQNYEPTGGTRDSSSYGTNYLRFTTGGEIMLGTGATNTNPTQRIKIKSNGHTGINANDPQTTLNVIGTISTGRNVARELGTIINVSSNHGGRPGTNVINGNKNYEYGSDWLAAGGSRVNANLTIDLGSAKTCDRFVIYQQNEYDNSRREVKNFTLEGSNDNSSWTTLLDDDCGCSHAHEPNPGFSFRLPEGNVYGVDDTEGVSYRYWRFTMKTFHGSDPYGGICELELYEVGDTTVSANKVGSEITTHSLVAGDISTQRMTGIQMLTSSEGLNIHTGTAASDTWEITETEIVTSGSFTDKSTIRHKRGVMAVSSSYNTGDLYIRIDNLYNLPGNAWWTFGLWIMTNQTVGTLAGHHSAMIHVYITGLGSWSSITSTDIQGSIASNVSIDSHGTNFVELKVDVSDSSRGPCTVLCNGGTFDPPRISFH